MKYTDNNVVRLDGNLITNTCNALRVAAERFDEDAKVCGEAERQNEGIRRLIEQFQKQAREARAVAALFEALESCDGNVCIATLLTRNYVHDILKGEG